MLIISWILFSFCLAAVAYLYMLALASFRIPKMPPEHARKCRFAIAVPAHNEEVVIAATIKSLKMVDYPSDLFDIYIVADHCTDLTAEIAQECDAFVFRRDDGKRGSKGAALAWLFDRIFNTGSPYEAIIIFDADTRVDPNFLQVMNRHVQSGAQVIQGNHIISNPDKGWFAALTWAMFMIDNRFQNLGRSVLGFSAKNMGDAICFRAEILQKYGWGEGLTEDYAFRQFLLLHGIRIHYEPNARSYGQAAINWQIAQRQRERWIKGVQVSNRNFRTRLFNYGIQKRDFAALEATLQGLVPSYSTLTVLVGVLLFANLLLSMPVFLIIAWVAILTLLFIYPFIGLSLERAPLKAFLVILTGPIFIFWRMGIILQLILRKKQVEWIRTPHHS